MQVMKTDVVVVAAGPSGLAAAIAAAEGGLKVIALEKALGTGGSANMGMGPLGIDTKIQRDELSSITVEKAFQMFMNYTHWRVDANLVKKYFEKSADTIEWLQEMGVEFYKAAKYFPGSENTWHIVKPESGKPGPRAAGTMLKRMTERAIKMGVQFMFETPGQSLIKENGRVCGVIAQKKDGEKLEIRCDAVVIATGGFGDDVKLLKEKTGYTYNKDYFGFRIPGLKGDGIRMAMEVGAASTDIGIEMAASLPGDNVTTDIHAAFSQPNLMVNLLGERFFDEGQVENATFLGNAVDIQKDRCGVMIIDESIKRQYMKYGVDVLSLVRQQKDIVGFDEHMEKAIEGGNPYLFKADTLEELAKKAGIKVDTFLKTVDMYNYYCETQDEQFHKRAKYMKPIVRPPFYAAKYFPGAYGTLGGIKINHYTEVIDKNFEPIPGLYAVGTDTCTIYGDSYMFLLPGNSMGYCLNTGRMAGENCRGYIKALRAQQSQAE